MDEDVVGMVEAVDGFWVVGRVTIGLGVGVVGIEVGSGPGGRTILM